MCRYRIYTIVSSLAFGCLSVFGQENPGSAYEFEFIRNTNPWLVSDNAAGLGTLQVPRTSFVEAYFDKDDGGLIPVEGSDNSLEAGALTESYVRISDRIAFHGKLSYSYFQGKNMNGHYLMDPSYNPINFLESTSDNPGIKVKELYSLLGAMSYALDSKWSLGVQFAYETGDYAKRKDPRPRSRWMSLDMTAGVRYAPADNFSFGLGLQYIRTSENLDCSIFGTTDQQYYTFVDYGGYLGMVEGLDGDYGYVKTTSPGRPMINTFYGGSLQLVFGREDNVRFFNELSYKYRDGHYGERSSNEAVYCEFGGSSVGYSGILDIRSQDNIHRISLDAGYSGLVNNENIYRRTTNPGGNTVVEYFGQNEIYRSVGFDGGLAYDGYLGVCGYRPSWEYGVSADGSYRIFRATYYPYYREQEITDIEVNLHGRKNITVARNIFTVSLAADFFTGFGTRNRDGVYASTSSDNHRTNDTYLNRDFEYDTASRIGGTLGFRYTRLFKKISAYIDVRDTYRHTLEKPEFLADGYRNVFTVSVGCAF